MPYNEMHDSLVEWMMDRLPYEFADSDEWNACRDKMFAMLQNLDQTRLIEGVAKLDKE